MSSCFEWVKIVPSLVSKVCLKCTWNDWKLSFFYLKELFVWYVNNTLHTSHCIMSCWETTYMIEIILLHQSKLLLLGVIRQIPLHAQFRVALFGNFKLQRYFYFYNNSLSNMTYAVCYLHIKRIVISQERRSKWRNSR